MPYSGIPNLQKGWEVVKASGCENAMLILDTWHWVRADQSYDILTEEQAKAVMDIYTEEMKGLSRSPVSMRLIRLRLIWKAGG